MGDAADFYTEQGIEAEILHAMNQCEGPCPYCEEEMSLTYTWLKCNDGQWYKEPVYREADYFICFDDNEPPEIVVKKAKYMTVEVALRQAQEILDRLKIKATIDKQSYFGGSSRCFEKGKMKFHKAFRFFIAITEPPPPPNEFQGTPTTEREKLDGCLYHCGTGL